VLSGLAGNAGDIAENAGHDGAQLSLSRTTPQI